MALYEVLAGVIHGKWKGETVNLTEDEAVGYGDEYVAPAKTKKEKAPEGDDGTADNKAKKPADNKAIKGNE